MTQGRDNREDDRGEMALDLEDVFETILITLLNVTKKSGNHMKDLRDDIMKSLSH